MGDSDEEEMRAMRSSSRYGGSSRPTTAKSAPSAEARRADSDDEDRPTRRMQIAARGKVGPRPGADDSDEEMAVEENPMAMMGFDMPMSFGKQKVAKKVGPEVHSTNQRRAKGVALGSAKSGGVQFGPKVMESASAGAKGRQGKELQAPQEEQPEEENDKAGPLVSQGEIEEPDVLPEPGKESEVLPVTHEVEIPAHDKAVTALGLDPKAARMITGSMDGNIKFFDFSGMSEAKESFRELEPVENHLVQAISFSTTGGQALVVCSDSSARIYDRDGTSTPIQSTVKGDMYVRQMENTKGHTQMLSSGMWHPFRQEYFLTSSLDGTMRIWDMNADPVGMDQQLPSIHVLKTMDRRNVCVGGGSGKQGGLYPTCCTYSPTDAKKIVGGCSDGSVQLFNDKARFLRPDRIVRTAHKEPITDIAFIPEGADSNLLVTRSLDCTMKVWDTRMFSDAKGPVKVFEDLATSHEKTGICVSPDGKYLVTGTSMVKGALGSATLRVFDAKSFASVKSLDFGKKSVLRIAWPGELNQVLVGTSAGDVVMLYSPFSSKKGALNFVGRKAKSKTAHDMEDAGTGPIFNMTDPAEMKKFYSTGHGDMTKIRRGEARQKTKAMIPTRPEDSGHKMPDQKFGDFAALALKVGAKQLHLNNTRVTDTDSQKALLEYQDKASAAPLVDTAYSKTQPQKILDWSDDMSEGDKRMQGIMRGEFCRKCGMKQCRCVDYSKYGESGKRPRTS